MNLWKFNAITGYWVHTRACTAETAPGWLAAYNLDDPDGIYCVAERKPRVDVGRILPAPRRLERPTALRALSEAVLERAAVAGGALGLATDDEA